MERIKEISAYLNRLCTAGREKSLLGMEAEAAEYFIKALEIAETFDHFLIIGTELYRSDLPGNKLFAYTCFLKALDASQNPVRQFRKTLFRKDMAAMVSEFIAKMPDQLFHILLKKCLNRDEEMLLAGIFQPFAGYISEPDPNVFLRNELKNAS